MKESLKVGAIWWQSSPFVNHAQTTKPSDTSRRLKEIEITAGLVGSMWLGNQKWGPSRQLLVQNMSLSCTDWPWSLLCWTPCRRSVKKKGFGVPSFYYTLAAAGQLGFDVDGRTTKQTHVRNKNHVQRCENKVLAWQVLSKLRYLATVWITDRH